MAKQAANVEVKAVPDFIAEMTTKSAKIRALAAEGFTTGEIAKSLGIRYQHARNVLKTPLKRVQA